MSTYYDGDASDLTVSDCLYPEYSGYQTGYGHLDSSDIDYGSLYLNSSGYFDVSISCSEEYTFAYIYDATTGTVLLGDGYQSRVYVDASHTNYVMVEGYGNNESYSVTVAPSALQTSDGDESDLTASDAIYPENSAYRTVYGHADVNNDIDYGMLYISSSGYFKITSTGSTFATIYDATTGLFLEMDELSLDVSNQSIVYVDASHTNCIVVNSYVAGESYSVTVTPFDYLHNMGRIYPSNGSYQTMYGYADSSGDMDYATLYLSSSGYYDLTFGGSGFGCVYDATSGAYVYGSSYQSNLYLDASHTNYVYAYDSTTGETYSVTVTPHLTTDYLNSMGYIYPSYSGYQTVYGYSDDSGDRDYAILSLSSSGYYDLTFGGSGHGWVYDATSDTNVTWLLDDNLYGGTYLYLDASHTNYVYAYDSTTGETYSVTVTPYYDCYNSMGYIYPSYSGYQTVYGYSDRAGDRDYATLYLSSSGYYDLTFGGSGYGYVYDATSGEYVYGSSYRSNLYLDSSHTNYVYAYDSTTGETYSVTVTPHTTTTTDHNNLIGNIYPSYSGYQTNYGYSDYSGDRDYAILYLSSSGYYDLTFGGSGYGYVYDSTSGTYVYGSSYQSNLYLDASHTNYVYAYGPTNGETYSVTVTPHSETDYYNSMGYIYPSYSGYQTVYGYSDYTGDMDYAILYLSSSGYYDLTFSGSGYGFVYDATSDTHVNWASHQSTLYLDASHTNCVYAYDSTNGEAYSVTVTPSTVSCLTDDDSTDLTAGKYVYPQESEHHTITGHTDSYGDWDYGTVFIAWSGYYDLSSTGNTAACIYDATAGTYLYGNNYQNNLFVDATHKNYLAVVGYSAGEIYSATVVPHA